MRPSVRRCNTTRLPSLATWTYTRTAEPRASGLAEPSHTCTGLSPRPATSRGAGAGGESSETATRGAARSWQPPFDRYSKLNIATARGPLPPVLRQPFHRHARPRRCTVPLADALILDSYQRAQRIRARALRRHGAVDEAVEYHAAPAAHWLGPARDPAAVPGPAP